MFTGIVEEMGEVTSIERLGDSVRLAVRGSAVTADAGHGDSIAVSGCCLTVVDVDGDVFITDVMQESLDRTALGRLDVGSPVNLERAVTVQTRLGGHLVQGHVDGTGVVVSREPSEHWDVVSVSMPADLSRYVAMKGSIAVDGVSLTVSALTDGEQPTFGVSLIPTTLAMTTLGGTRVGDRVNLEVDMLAKYVERLLQAEHTQEGRP